MHMHTGSVSNEQTLGVRNVPHNIVNNEQSKLQRWLNGSIKQKQDNVRIT